MPRLRVPADAALVAWFRSALALGAVVAVVTPATASADNRVPFTPMPPGYATTKPILLAWGASMRGFALSLTAGQACPTYTCAGNRRAGAGVSLVHETDNGSERYDLSDIELGFAPPRFRYTVDAAMRSAVLVADFGRWGGGRLRFTATGPLRLQRRPNGCAGPAVRQRRWGVLRGDLHLRLDNGYFGEVHVRHLDGLLASALFACREREPLLTATVSGPGKAFAVAKLAPDGTVSTTVRETLREDDRGPYRNTRDRLYRRSLTQDAPRSALAVDERFSGATLTAPGPLLTGQLRIAATAPLARWGYSHATAVSDASGSWLARFHSPRPLTLTPTGTLDPEGTLQPCGNTAPACLVSFDPGSVIRPCPVAVTVAPSGDVYALAGGSNGVCSRAEQRITEYAPDGRVVRRFGGLSAGDPLGSGQGWTGPSGLAAAPSGDVYVAETDDDRITEYAPDGRVIRAWGRTGQSGPSLDGPRAIAVDDAGHVFVASAAPGYARIQEFTGDGDYVGDFSGMGVGPGEFVFPTGLAVAPSGDVYVADGQARLERFDSAHRFVASWTIGETFLHELCGLAADETGAIFAVDAEGPAIDRFAQDGTTLGSWGQRGLGDGQLWPDAGLPNHAGVATAPGGVIYVADPANHRIQKFTADGRWLASLYW